MSLMSWSSNFQGKIPTLSLPVGDQAVVLGPDDAAMMHHVLSEFLQDCSMHRRSPNYQPNRKFTSRDCTTKPDWGHGPNPPVQTFTEDQICAAFGVAGQRAAEQLIGILKENRAAGKGDPH